MTNKVSVVVCMNKAIWRPLHFLVDFITEAKYMLISFGVLNKQYLIIIPVVVLDFNLISVNVYHT